MIRMNSDRVDKWAGISRSRLGRLTVIGCVAHQIGDNAPFGIDPHRASLIIAPVQPD